MTFKLNEQQAKWMDALRSGQYPKGTNYLDKDGKYCCLGVACSVLADEYNLRVTGTGVISFMDSETFGGNGKTETALLTNTQYLPVSLRSILGIDHCGKFITPYYYKDRTYISLTDLNDNSDITFIEMAVVIEANWQSGNFKQYVKDNFNPFITSTDTPPDTIMEGEHI